jgi:choline monooxygenase
MIDPDIRRARTLPAAYYTDPELHARLGARVFGRAWQLVDADAAGAAGSVAPFTQTGCGEPMLLARDGAGTLRALSNVCTHRGNLVCTEAGPAQGLRCRYHGRRFGLDGRFISMPEFEGVADFPSAEDDLAPAALATLGPLTFVALDPERPFAELAAPVEARVALDGLEPDPSGTRAYEVAANWALYCDNYLEGFHVPFVHPGLARAIDYGSYETELLGPVILQVAQAADGAAAFPGSTVAAYYFFLFPTTMLNFYPWGLSVNVVVPLAVDRSRILYRRFVRDRALLEVGAGAGLDRVEAEDEAVVEQVQIGVRARGYRRGRYSPSRETGVHHFHRLLVSAA